MREQPREVSVQAADLAALIERATVDLALSEEPGGFQVALEAAGDE